MERCEGCREPATSLCVCTFPWPKFCSSCSESHLSTTRSKHKLEPLAARTFLYGPEALPAYYDRQYVVSKSLDYLQLSRNEMKQCQEQVEELIQTIQSKVNLWISATRQQLSSILKTAEQEITEMEAAIENLRFNVRGSGRELEEMVERARREDVERVKDKVNLIKCEFKPYLLTAALSEILSLSLQPSLLHSTPCILHFLSESQQILKYSLSDNMLYRCPSLRDLPLFSGAAWCLLGEKYEYLYSGGQHNAEVMKGCWVVNSGRMQVRNTGEMMYARYLHTLVGTQDVVYALGGNGGSRGIRECEEYRRETGKWARIADMHERRFGATGCLYKSSVYIAGGVGSDTAEVYSPQVNQFTRLSLTLPSNNKFTTALVLADTLIILQEANMYQWSLSHSNKSLQPTHPLPQASNWYSPLQPFVHQSNLYFLRNDYEIWRLSTPTNNIELVTPFI